ncbi:DUF58 domain-containing protein [Paracoccus sp. p3-h83]|uniref:DUF58 domain-containing protein n=1 Tax=Paracoccus sp. p3-h83 TaxID=3342805 RepID=UPI0035B9460B
MTTSAADLRRGAEAAAAGLPALVMAARHLAASVAPGLHGRRRAGAGEDFWQYRPAQPGDSARQIDWRRSARGDTAFVRDREAQAAQTLAIWVDPAARMDFTAAPGRPTKADRARLLALAAAALALRGGERVALADPGARAGQGLAQLTPLAAGLIDVQAAAPALPTRGRALILSDFLGDLAPFAAMLTDAADRAVSGVLVQVLDPAEASFPFAGRTILHEGGLAHDTARAEGLRDRYLARLADRRAELAALAQGAGWRLVSHVTDMPPALALMALHQGLGTA